MTIQINYKDNSTKKVSSNLVLFVDEKFNINSVKKYISNTEYLYISDLLKNSDLKKQLLLFEINSKKTILKKSLDRNTFSPKKLRPIFSPACAYDPNV